MPTQIADGGSAGGGSTTQTQVASEPKSDQPTFYVPPNKGELSGAASSTGDGMTTPSKEEFYNKDAPTPAMSSSQTIDSQATPDTMLAEPGKIGDTSQATASGAEASDAYAVRSKTSGYNAKTGEIDPNTMTASGQMTQITGQDSPLMNRAKESGMLTAASRGLQNSSIAAGAAMGEMVDRATPLAQQDAATYFENMRQNTDAINRQREVNTGRRTDVSMQNAALGTDVNKQNAAAETDVAMFNAGEKNKLNSLQAQLDTAVSQGNQDAINKITQQMAEINAGIDIRNAEMETEVDIRNADVINDINKQILSGNQQIDLAALRGSWSHVINGDATAAAMYDSFASGVATVMSNPDITPQRAAGFINVMAEQLNASLGIISAIQGIETPTPGADTEGMGKYERVVPE